MARRGVLAAGLGDGGLALDLADLLVEAMDLGSLGGALGDQALDRRLGGLELPGAVRDLDADGFELAFARQHPGGRVGAVDVEDSALGPQPILGDEGDAWMLRRQTLGVGRGRDEGGGKRARSSGSPRASARGWSRAGSSTAGMAAVPPGSGRRKMPEPPRSARRCASRAASALASSTTASARSPR